MKKHKTEIRVIYEDDFMFAIDKTKGMVSVPAPNIPEWRTAQGELRAWAISNKKNFKPYLLNRLDRLSSGVLLFGKYPRDREKLENILKDARTKKTYLALVKGVPKFKESTIRIPLEARTIRKKIPAITHYKILKKIGFTSLLEVQIETGRYHQIRKHLSMIANPLVLDPDYGDRSFNRKYQKLLKGKGRYFLHAWKIKFFHPFLNKWTEIMAGISMPFASD